MRPTETLDKLIHTWDSISALCADLSEAQWKTLTSCPGWTVQDNLSHLVGVERLILGLPVTRHRAGEHDHVKNPIGEFNEHEVDSRRHLSGAEVLEEWNEIIAGGREFFDEADDDYFSRETMTPVGPGTIADFLHVRVLDCWAHEQDMRRAVGKPGNDDSPAAEHTIDRLLRTIPIVVGKRAKTPEGRGVLLEIAGPVRRSVPVLVTNGRAAIVDGVPDPIVTVKMDSNTFCELAMGRIDPATARVEVVGDQSLGRAIVDNLNMMI
jgi:uncharacterized protein (TIGR03083 family)